MSYKQVVITKFGPPEVLKMIEKVHAPAPQSGEVRVKVLVTSACFTDTLLRIGKYPEVRQKPPFPPGYDMVGIVDALGDGVSSVQVGQRVAALTVFGAYSEYMCLAQDRVVPVPENVDSAEAVSLILTYITAYQMLHRTVQIQRGQRILVHGAGGAVGIALLQLGKLLDLDMYGTGSASKQDIIKELGATPINYQSEDFVERIQALTGDGVDAVFDAIGGDYFKRSFATLRPGGTLAAYGFQKALTEGGSLLDIIGAFLKLKLWDLLPNQKSATFYTITSLQKKHPDWFRHDLAALFELLQQRKIVPRIVRKMPLADAAKAHELVDKAAVAGKIVLVVSDD